MRAGWLRHRLIVQKVSESRDGTGFAAQSWSQFAEVWGAVNPMRGREIVEARQVHERVDTLIKLRYLEGLTSKHRILHADRFQALAAAVANTSVTTITVAGAWPAQGPFRIEVDSEIMLVTAGSSGTSWTVERGVDGTTAATHALGAQVRRLRIFEIESAQDLHERHREWEVLAVSEPIG